MSCKAVRWPGDWPRQSDDSLRTRIMSEGRVSILTGAVGGLGRATARQLVEQGYQIALVDVDTVGLKELSSSLGGAVASYPVDLTDGWAIDEMVAAVDREFGRVDLLVNNAGTAIRGTVEETEPADWDRIMAVNVTAMYRASRAVIPRFRAAGGGVIINISSAAAIAAVANRAAYCASKAAVIGLTRAMAVDHTAEGIRVNAICPGVIDTPWVHRIAAASDDPSATLTAMAARQLTGRMGTPDEVANAILFLASDQATFVNGAAFVVDGGFTAA